MASGKEIKWRIKTVKNTAKITKAMELISTVKMKKAQDSVLSSRPFAIEAIKILKEVWDSLKESVYLAWPKKKTKKELMVIISSNKWLCWGYNVNVFKKAASYIKENKDKQFDFITVWKKSQDFVVKTWWNLIEDFSEAIKDNIEISDSKLVSKNLITKYASWEYDKIIVIYSYYYSAITQKALAKQFLMIDKADIIEYLEDIVWVKVEDKWEAKEYKIEPNKETIANEVIPMILDMMFYEILLEAKASEHASRMVAMKNAKDSAGKKVFELTLTYNKARQASITKEISEIVSWVESMKD
ncbi:MAG: ATP synthase F1, gamma subunit [uncultured bacterium (gcode 4)]|uniref:ATP synthase gamma chain n=1 Tax=uncultured bacterium (gcode 4) TaxID=1234023 RepID=K2FY54_9BACT|nr:MAG: ATP synthase F1, gamma subunit [uncultured bacterium (gcode 4)]